MAPKSDDSDLLKQVQATHSPDGREIRIKPLLHLLEDTLKHATQNEDPSAAAHVHAKALQDSNLCVVFDELAPCIDQIANKITCKYSIGATDAHSTTIAILNMLNNFSWDAKLIIILKAFTMCFVEFSLIVESYNSGPLAQCLAILKQMPVPIREILNPQAGTIESLLKVVLKILKSIVELQEHPVVRGDFGALTTTKEYIPIVVYGTIRSIVVASLQIPFHVWMRQEATVSTEEAGELARLTHELHIMYSRLQDQLIICYQLLGKKRYQSPLHVLEVAQTDNTKVLKALLDLKGDLQPLVDGTTKKRVGVQVFEKKTVLLLISELDIPEEDLGFLESVFAGSSREERQQYDIVWLPILDTTLSWTGDKQKQFDNLQVVMPWYTVHNPLLIKQGVNKFVKKVWHFKKKPRLLVFDPQGWVTSPNALHMIYIWGTAAFPFTRLRERALWKVEDWTPFELLVDGLDPVILDSIKEGKYICLYGGEDIEWIRKFTSTTRAVTQTAGISLEMVYVGGIKPKDKIQSNISTIIVEKLSHCWQDLSMIWIFWSRIESMWHSKNLLGKTVDDDPMMQEIKMMLTYDNNGEGWAMLSRGATMMVKAKGSTFLSCMSDYSAWKAEAEKKGFSEALNDHLAKLHTRHHWNKLALPETVEKMPKTLLCAECGYRMGRFVMYQSWMRN